MVLRKITVGVKLSETIINELKAEYPNIILEVYEQTGNTIFKAEITPAQETQIIPVINSKLVKIENWTTM